MPRDVEKAFEKNGGDVSTNSETSPLLERVSKIQESVKNRCSPLPADFDEKAFMDEGWEG